MFSVKFETLSSNLNNITYAFLDLLLRRGLLQLLQTYLITMFL